MVRDLESAIASATEISPAPFPTESGSGSGSDSDSGSGSVSESSSDRYWSGCGLVPEAVPGWAILAAIVVSLQ